MAFFRVSGSNGGNPTFDVVYSSPSGGSTATSVSISAGYKYVILILGDYDTLANFPDTASMSPSNLSITELAANGVRGYFGNATYLLTINNTSIASSISWTTPRFVIAIGIK